MSIDKLEKPRLSDTDPSSIDFRRMICCYKCGESQFTLKRVKSDDGTKIRPAKYVCVNCG